MEHIFQRILHIDEHAGTGEILSAKELTPEEFTTINGRVFTMDEVEQPYADADGFSRVKTLYFIKEKDADGTFKDRPTYTFNGWGKNGITCKGIKACLESDEIDLKKGGGQNPNSKQGKKDKLAKHGVDEARFKIIEDCGCDCIK